MACCLPHDGFVNGRAVAGAGVKAEAVFTCAKLDFPSTSSLIRIVASFRQPPLPFPTPSQQQEGGRSLLLLVSALKLRDEQMTKAMAAQWAF